MEIIIVLIIYILFMACVFLLGYSAGWHRAKNPSEKGSQTLCCYKECHDDNDCETCDHVLNPSRYIEKHI